MEPGVHAPQLPFPSSLRPMREADIPTLHSFECDAIANTLAGVKPRTREAFVSRFLEVLRTPAINIQVIVPAGPQHGVPREEVLGSVTVFQAEGRDNLGYWISRPHWGKRIASRAVAMFLAMETRRPLRATAASNNVHSRRVLEKNGFRLVSEHFAEETDRYMARQIVEYILE